MQEAIEQTTICLNCLTVNLFDNAYNDGVGWHVVCPVCKSNYDIGIEEYLIESGTVVRYWGNGKGIIDKNDADIAKEFKDINYYVYSMEFVHIKDKSDYYNLFKRNEFEIMEELTND